MTIALWSVKARPASLTNNTGPRRAFRFDANTGEVIELGSLGGKTGSSNARGINNSSLIVGESATTNGIHAVRFELDGSITDLGTLGGEGSSAADINDHGDIGGPGSKFERELEGFSPPGRWSNERFGNSWR
jgi:probable HAF family extracellular repeat protein